VLSYFFGSARNATPNLNATSAISIPLPVFISSFLGGSLSGFAGELFHLCRIDLKFCFVSCAASFMIFHAVGAKKKLSHLEIAAGVTALIVVLFVVRPHWLATLVNQVPLYRSLRWPFRETFNFLFWIHIWIALRPVALPARAVRFSTLAGAMIFLLALVAFTPRSFAPMENDRHLLISGKADTYWKQIQPLLNTDDQLIAVVPPPVMKKYFGEIPYTLLGAYNYAALFRVPGASGYTASGLGAEGSWERKPYHWSGVFSPADGDYLLNRHPHLKALYLVSLYPLRIELRSAHERRVLDTPQLPQR
jgi:hypothetical protein